MPAVESAAYRSTEREEGGGGGGGGEALTGSPISRASEEFLTRREKNKN